jgi:hypothetical protein
MDSQEHLRRAQWHSIEWLGEHQLLAEDYWDEGRGARWVLGQPGMFLHQCEIIAGIGGSLIVHGDFDVCRFAHYGDHADAFSRLCWMGLCYDVHYYVAQKASIGMSRHNKSIETYCDDVAKHDLRSLLRDYREEDVSTELCELLSEALESHTESEYELRSFLAERDHWDLWEHSFGRVLDPHVVTSHVALNRTACLLIEKYGQDGPPACRARKAAQHLQLDVSQS